MIFNWVEKECISKWWVCDTPLGYFTVYPPRSPDYRWSINKDGKPFSAASNLLTAKIKVEEHLRDVARYIKSLNELDG